MKFKTIFIATLLGFSSMTLMAGSGHDHGHSHDAPVAVNQSVATENATKVVASLIKKNKLEKSWSSIKAGSVEKKIYNNTPEWVVTFVNEKITDVTKQKLYVFLTPGGDYIAANYTGK